MHAAVNMCLVHARPFWHVNEEETKDVYDTQSDEKKEKSLEKRGNHEISKVTQQCKRTK